MRIRPERPTAPPYRRIDGTNRDMIRLFLGQNNTSARMTQ
jgi:hypothetical protein